ncbi:MAG: efflux RND transporter periplasmic adaptor subunit [Tannerella sp.]|jgi:Cu(I)/Ag(I) efflux system membrane fusion protein|nr:efflux RND transporter periplasmic adaptor subunit [Tannerella sp.]
MKTGNFMIYGLFLVAGVFLGWLLFGRTSGHNQERAEHIHSEAEARIWTCSMHPQIRLDKPGKCPLCAMDLIPLRTMQGGGEAIDPDAIMLSEEAVALANIRTTAVSRSRPVKEVNLYGTIQPNERLLRSLVSHVNGRIEKLNISFTGETIREGQVIASIYSPDLRNAQQELLEAVKIGEAQPALLRAAREKLRLWKLTDRQIAGIEQSGEVSPLVDIVANTGGIVITKNVEQGDYVTQGGVLFNLADLSSVWAMFDAYEADLPYLKTGDKATYTLQALPGKTFQGKITFIDPILDKTTRTAKVRVETSNPGLQLKPEMYARAVVESALEQRGEKIVIPKTAVLWTGKRSIVYVKQPDADMPAFHFREIELGPALGDAYVVLSGIAEGEEIVTNGAFTIDASAQLEGKLSMMNRAETGPASDLAGHVMLKVEGMCEMCKDRIEHAAKGLAGVVSSSWDSETGQLHLNIDAHKISVNDISKAIAKAGHDTGMHKADKAVYDALPDCCKYRK